MKNKTNLDEYVLVFKTSLLSQIGYFQGLCFDYSKYIDAIELNYEFIIRNEAEKNHNYKQVISYVILNYRDEIFCYERGALLSEKRLINNYSIGIGGHISIHDPSLFSTPYKIGMYREVKEELYVDTEYLDKTIAVLNDDSNEVGKVHFGIIHVFKLDKPLVRKKEKCINKPHFIKRHELIKQIENYENWSQICIKNLDKLIGMD